MCLFNDTTTTEINTYGHTLSQHDDLPIIVEHGPDTLFLRIDTLFDALPERGGLGTNAVDQTRQTSDFRSFCQGVWTGANRRSEEHTSELQSLMRISYAFFCLKKTHSSYLFLLSSYISHLIISYAYY